MNREQKFKIKLIENGYSQKKFAEEIGITPTYLSRIIKGKNNPNVMLALEITKKLNTSIEFLFSSSNYD